MRIEELLKGGTDGCPALRLEQPVTVIGPASSERRRWLAQALLGGPYGRPGAVLHVRDSTGRRARIDPEGITYLDDGSPAHTLTNLLRPDATAHRAHMCIGPGSLGLPVKALSPRHRAELDAARIARAQLIREVASRSAVDARAVQHRLEAMSARVRDLEARYGHASVIPPLDEIRDRLLARLTALTHVAGSDETLPVIFDDPLVSVPVEQRCDLLDLLLRTSDRVQVIYLTEDAVVLRWARSQAPVLGISVLAPTVESG